MKKPVFSRLFYKGKYHKKEEKDSITAMLLPSVFGILLCAVCLMGSTWAWFIANQSTATQTIQAANYNVSAVIKSGGTEVLAEDGVYSLAAGEEYTVTLTASGDATTGYCVLDFGNEIRAYTEQIAQAASITVTLHINEPATLKITAVWGKSAGENRLGAEYTYGTAAAAEEAAVPDEAPEPAEKAAVPDEAPAVTEPAEETTPPSTETEPTETHIQP